MFSVHSKRILLQTQQEGERPGPEVSLTYKTRTTPSPLLKTSARPRPRVIYPASRNHWALVLRRRCQLLPESNFNIATSGRNIQNTKVITASQLMQWLSPFHSPHSIHFFEVWKMCGVNVKRVNTISGMGRAECSTKPAWLHGRKPNTRESHRYAGRR